jgi:hypothetical protein
MIQQSYFLVFIQRKYTQYVKETSVLPSLSQYYLQQPRNRNDLSVHQMMNE